MSMTMEEDDDDVEKFLEKVVVLKRKVEEQGETISDNTFMGVLARLPQEYDTILSILDATENLTPDTMINTILETYRKKKKQELGNSTYSRSPSPADAASTTSTASTEPGPRKRRLLWKLSWSSWSWTR